MKKLASDAGVFFNRAMQVSGKAFGGNAVAGSEIRPCVVRALMRNVAASSGNPPRATQTALYTQCSVIIVTIRRK